MIRKIYYSLLIAVAMALSVIAQGTQISRSACPGPSPNPAQPIVEVTLRGAINLVPCAGQTVNISGSPGVGIVSLNGLTGATQTFAVGSAGTNFNIISAGTVHTFNLPNASASNRGLLTAADWLSFSSRLFNGGGSANAFPLYSAPNTVIASPLTYTNGEGYTFSNAGGTNTYLINLFPGPGSSGLVSFGDSFSGLTLDQDAQVFQGKGHSGIDLDSGTSTTTIGDTAGAGNSTKFIVNDSASEYIFNALTSNGVVSVGSSNELISNVLTDGRILIGRTGNAPQAATITAGTNIAVSTGAGSITVGTTTFTTLPLTRTITPIGTTGNVTINQIAGTVNIAAVAATATVTNSLVTANSLVLAIARTNDTTCAVKNIVPGAGSFVVNMTANCTAATSVGFIVTN